MKPCNLTARIPQPELRINQRVERWTDRQRLVTDSDSSCPLELWQGDKRVWSGTVADLLAVMEERDRLKKSLDELLTDFAWILNHCQWSNINGRQGYVLAGWNDRHSLCLHNIRAHRIENERSKCDGNT